MLFDQWIYLFVSWYQNNSFNKYIEHHLYGFRSQCWRSVNNNNALKKVVLLFAKPYMSKAIKLLHSHWMADLLKLIATNFGYCGVVRISQASGGLEFTNISAIYKLLKSNDRMKKSISTIHLLKNFYSIDKIINSKSCKLYNWLIA